MRVTPSMVQDEFGGENAPDYLCALFAAEYTLEAALRLVRVCGVRVDKEEGDLWRTVLREGLAYYLTSTGLFMQAVCDVFAGDWNGRWRGAPPASWGGGEAWNLRRLGPVAGRAGRA